MLDISSSTSSSFDEFNTFCAAAEYAPAIYLTHIQFSGDCVVYASFPAATAATYSFYRVFVSDSDPHALPEMMCFQNSEDQLLVPVRSETWAREMLLLPRLLLPALLPRLLHQVKDPAAPFLRGVVSLPAQGFLRAKTTQMRLAKFLQNLDPDRVLVHSRSLLLYNIQYWLHVHRFHFLDQQGHGIRHPQHLHLFVFLCRVQQSRRRLKQDFVLVRALHETLLDKR